MAVPRSTPGPSDLEGQLPLTQHSGQSEAGQKPQSTFSFHPVGHPELQRSDKITHSFSLQSRHQLEGKRCQASEPYSPSCLPEVSGHGVPLKASFIWALVLFLSITMQDPEGRNVPRRVLCTESTRINIVGLHPPDWCYGGAGWGGCYPAKRRSFPTHDSPASYSLVGAGGGQLWAVWLRKVKAGGQSG